MTKTSQEQSAGTPLDDPNHAPAANAQNPQSGGNANANPGTGADRVSWSVETQPALAQTRSAHTHGAIDRYEEADSSTAGQETTNTSVDTNPGTSSLGSEHETTRSTGAWTDGCEGEARVKGFNHDPAFRTSWDDSKGPSQHAQVTAGCRLGRMSTGWLVTRLNYASYVRFCSYL
ncbi:uncharacterized protein LTR77_006544 [Saxophila tyrrhenica]|uniref:Uncharacterized protein n=1 Tax=Saxophila tyrrhenica TaxID=1690608 RepID=A0AAV9P560_9PEZI|nr:hypothetical protein LTR77_006544 [Saxophila tyrrhenica]